MPRARTRDTEELELRVREALGRRLRALRQDRGLNQDDFADELDLHRSHVGLLENGKLDPRLSTLTRVAARLGITPAQLLQDLELD